MSEFALTPGLRYAARDLLPHRDTLLLLDELDGYGADWICMRRRVRATEPSATQDGVPAWAGIEYMAQTAAAWGGIERLQRGLPVNIGFLLGTRRYQANVDFFPMDAELRIYARLVMRDEHQLAAFECEIEHNGVRLAWADIKAYRPENVDQFLEA